MNQNLNQAQFSHPELGSTASMYRSPKQPYSSGVQKVVHSHRGVGTAFVAKGELTKPAKKFKKPRMKV